MKIIDLNDDLVPEYLICLEEWSDDMKDAGNFRSEWLQEMLNKGLRVKLAMQDNGIVAGFIQYAPVEQSIVDGKGCYFCYCIWIHGHKAGRGDLRGKGLGRALLSAAEDDTRKLGATGLACWGIILPFWMRSSWFKKQGYKRCDRLGMAELVFKPFMVGAEAPKWFRQRKKPLPEAGGVNVVSLSNGWCSAQNIAQTRIEKVAKEYPGLVRFVRLNTRERSILEEWGCSDAIFIDGRELRIGPPPSEKSIRKTLEKSIKKHLRSHK